MKSSMNSLATTPQQHGTALRERLLQKYGVRLDDAFRGALVKGAGDVRVELEPPDGVFLSSPVEAGSAVTALRANANLPATLRYAMDYRGWHLIADTRLNGEVHLPKTMGELRRGIERVRNGKKRRSRRTPGMSKADRASLEQAMKEASLEDSPPVRLDDAWETRCRLGGQIVATRISVSGTGIRIYRNVAPGLEIDEPGAEAVADAALRLNHQIRHARVALTDTGLCVEACLSAHMIDAAWLAFQMRAVAAAYLYVAFPLRVLASQPRVALWWSAVSNPGSC